MGSWHKPPYRRQNMMRTLFTVLFASIALAGCEGPIGEQGPAGPQGTKGDKGDPAMSGSVSVLPWAKCTTVELDKPDIDLGQQMKTLLDQYSCLDARLPAKTKWTWNQQVILKDFQSLTVSGGGFANNAPGTISTEIQFTQNRTFKDEGGKDTRTPNRILVGGYGQFWLEGVLINETAADGRDLTPICYEKGLFGAVSSVARGSIMLKNLVIKTSENIVALSSEASVRIIHVWAQSAVPMSLSRIVNLVSAERSYCAAGVSATVFLNNYNPTKIELDKTPGLVYLP